MRIPEARYLVILYFRLEHHQQCSMQGSYEALIRCESNEIIDIHSVTIAVLDQYTPCTTSNVLGRIESLNPPCKRSHKDNTRIDGIQLYHRYVKKPTNV